MIRTTFDDPARGLAILLLLLLLQRWLVLVVARAVVRSARRRPVSLPPRHAYGAPGRVDVVVMCANLDDDQRARYGGARTD